MTDDTGKKGVAIVTGGSRGIGRAITEALLKEGWRVRFCCLSAEVEEAERELRESCGDATAVTGRGVDVRNQEEVDAFVEETLREEGRIDCLVNNAGIGIFGAVDEMTGEQWRAVIETNLSGCFYFLHAVAPTMKRQRTGWIFNISSLSGKHPAPGCGAYSASKSGLITLSDAAMLDLRPHGVRVAVILPGFVDTGFSHQGDRKDRSWMLKPADIATMILHLLSYPSHVLPNLVEMWSATPPTKA
jgi:3-oxoacyl-[acyl-carrier protein] reductase